MNTVENFAFWCAALSLIVLCGVLTMHWIEFLIGTIEYISRLVPRAH